LLPGCSRLPYSPDEGRHDDSISTEIMHRFGLNAGSGRRAAITVKLALAVASLAGTAQASALTAGAPSAVAATTKCRTISWDASDYDNTSYTVTDTTDDEACG
jgi:hypothetical protein